MANLSASELLDKIASRVEDSSSTMRSKLLVWLNEVMEEVAIAKVLSPPWEFLCKDVEGAIISSNKIAKPIDFRQVVTIKSGQDWFLSQNDHLTEEEAFLAADPNATSPTPLGFTTDKNSIILIPGASGTADLRYMVEIPEYTDSADETLFPKWMLNVLIRGVLCKFYEADAEEHARFSDAPRLYDQAMRAAKKKDNASRPMPKRNRRGYIRWRK